ncbi:hypothetical protein [Streptomyces sp. NPDC096033]|uniref:hypothetical protein n=1 Tax=Streptomyces sp. NPDC096033 TaxID=3366071 RepID=UPI0037F770C3
MPNEPRGRRVRADGRPIPDAFNGCQYSTADTVRFRDSFTASQTGEQTLPKLVSKASRVKGAPLLPLRGALPFAYR